MELQKRDSQEMDLRQSLAVAIQDNGTFNLALVNKVAIHAQLAKYKQKNGNPNFGLIFKIPLSDRIAAMAEKDFPNTVQIISVAIASAMESINLQRPMTNSQIFDLAEAIIDEAKSDNLSIEDLMLFLQQLVRGKYETFYEGIDIPKFMDRFGKYRDERWNEGVRIRDEKHEEYKLLGETKRAAQADTALDDHLQQFTSKLGEMRDELKAQREENKRLREQRDF